MLLVAVPPRITEAAAWNGSAEKPTTAAPTKAFDTRIEMGVRAIFMNFSIFTQEVLATFSLILISKPRATR
jgi:hypothetical protein